MLHAKAPEAPQPCCCRPPSTIYLRTFYHASKKRPGMRAEKKKGDEKKRAHKDVRSSWGWRAPPRNEASQKVKKCKVYKNQGVKVLASQQDRRPLLLPPSFPLSFRSKPETRNQEPETSRSIILRLSLVRVVVVRRLGLRRLVLHVVLLARGPRVPVGLLAALQAVRETGVLDLADDGCTTNPSSRAREYRN